VSLSVGLFLLDTSALGIMKYLQGVVLRFMTNEALLSQRQVAELFGLSERTLEAMRLRGAGPAFVRFSRRCVRYRAADIDRFIMSRTVNGEVENRSAA
jgi:predicted DNA-binding transcriptional regulator AlpA